MRLFCRITENVLYLQVKGERLLKESFLISYLTF